MRKIQRWKLGGGWETVTEGLAGIRSGDVFRMFEPDGAPVESEGGASIWKAESDGSRGGPHGTGIVTAAPYSGVLMERGELEIGNHS